MDRCVQCGVCMPVCPTYAVDRDETRMARGRITLIRAALEGRLGISETFQDRITSCIGCLACDAVCPSGVPVGEIVLAAKARIAERRGIPLLARLASRVAIGWRWPLPIALKIAAPFSAIYRRFPLWGPLPKFLPFVHRGKKRLLPKTGKSALLSRFPEVVRT
ncbi:MAG: (Fe-S)-binding protein, partial [Nitrospirae bacterium]|nr:(Fe-S)-binding protein [Nitrospirota bacterium]